MESGIKKTRRFWPLAAGAALLLVLMAPPAQAAINTWVGPKPNTLWTNPNNWSIGSPPGGGDTVNLTSTTNKTAFYDTTLNPLLKFLTVDASGGSTFTLSMPGNTLSIDFTEIIGDSGKGQVVQSGGTNNSGDGLALGNNPGSSGTYTLSGGSLFTHLFQYIGNSGTGLFTQTGGSNKSNDSIVLGYNPGSVGTYNLNGGHLQATNETVGRDGTGTFNQLTNSTNIVSGTLSLGSNPQGKGTYNMKGGWLQADAEIVGDEGKGAFTQSGGTHLITSNLTLGRAATGSGTFTLQAGSLSAFNAFIGDSGVGQFIQNGGTNTVASELYLGYVNPTGSGTYTLNAGQLQSHSVEVGLDGTGIFTQNGGTHTVDNALSLGDNPGSKGTYNLVKGTLSVTGAGKEYVGYSGIGTFNQTGGTHTVASTLFVGNGNGSGTGPGTFNLQGGTLSAGLIQINDAGTFNVKNTTTTVTGDVLNNGTVKTTNANVTWNGNFTNRSAYISDPSTQTFNQDLVVAGPGYLVGGSQDLFILKDDFLNGSLQSSQWNTVLSTLKFVTGTDNIHTMMVPGQDNSSHGQANNFTWGSLNLTGQKLVLSDGNLGNLSTAFYAEAFIGATFSGLTLTNISNADLDPINIYYNVHLAANAYLHGLTYNIPGGGQLIPHAPVPPSVLLLGSGLLGLGALGWRRKKRG
jgi:hypothetical protein